MGSQNATLKKWRNRIIRNHHKKHLKYNQYTIIQITLILYRTKANN